MVNYLLRPSDLDNCQISSWQVKISRRFAPLSLVMAHEREMLPSICSGLVVLLLTNCYVKCNDNKWFADVSLLISHKNESSEPSAMPGSVSLLISQREKGI